MSVRAAALTRRPSTSQYVILRNVLVGAELETVREAYEVLVERQIQRWADEDRTGHGGTWTSSAQPRLNLRPSAADSDRGLLLDKDTAAAIEFWCHPNVQGASSQLLGVEDAGVTEMMLMCSPQKDHGPSTWHRVRRAAFGIALSPDL